MGLRENDHGHRINGEFGFFDWLPTRGSRETDVDNANTPHIVKVIRYCFYSIAPIAVPSKLASGCS
jgi:hypothetical protein